MRYQHSLLLVGLLVASCASDGSKPLPASGPLPEAPQSTIGYSSVAEALAALRAKPGVTVSVQGGWTIISDKESDKVSSLWSFTPVGHPAHPAAVKREVFERDGAVYVETKILCQAAKGPCDQLVRDFNQLNEQMKQRMRGEKP